MPCKEIGIKESNGDVRTLTEVHTWPFLRLLKIALNAVRLPKFEPFIVVAEKDHGKRFTATFQAGVILRMRRELRGL